MNKRKPCIPSDVMQGRRAVLRVAGLGAVGALTGVMPDQVLALQRTLRWGSSSLGSTGYVIMEAFAHAVTEYAGIRSTSLATAGTSENMALIGAGRLEFGHSATTDWPVATKGLKPFRAPIKVNQLFGYATWYEPPIVHADSDIQTIDDLVGKRFSPSKAGSGTALLYHTIMKANGLFDRIDWTYGSWNEIYSAFKARQIHGVAGVLANGKPSPGVVQVEAAVEVRALEFPEEMLEKAQKLNPGIIITRLGTDDWPTLTKPTLMPAIGGVVATHPGVTAEEGYEVTKAILENTETLHKVGEPLHGVGLESAVGTLMLDFPVNAGAAKYFKEKGVWREELTVAS
jgi:TRAP transporter TAXI family solute receptor